MFPQLCVRGDRLSDRKLECSPPSGGVCCIQQQHWHGFTACKPCRCNQSAHTPGPVHTVWIFRLAHRHKGQRPPRRALRARCASARRSTTPGLHGGDHG
jgi:hypothetical protein